MKETWQEAVSDAVRSRTGDGLIETVSGPEMPVLIIEAGAIMDVAQVLRDAASGVEFRVLLDITAVDYLKYPDSHPQRFAVVWHFLDPESGRQIRVKAFLSGGESPPSLTSLYPAANWAEREVFDMMGIGFSGHPNMVRILMPYDYEGNPQRKDFPLEGPERAKQIHGELLGNKALTSWKELHDL